MPSAVSELLQRTVDRAAPASVLLVHGRRERPARFVAVDASTVTLRLLDDASTDGSRGSGGVASVQFDVEDRRRLFLARVRQEVRGCLVMELPDAIATMEARRAFRVPVAPGEQPVEVVGPAGRVHGMVGDLSTLGVGILLEEVDRSIELGDAVRVRLGDGEGRRVLAGTVVQRGERRMGIAFAADGASRISDLVDEVEARWRARQRG